jgi:hypothetical protein
MRVEWVRLAFLAIGVLAASAAGADFNGPVSFVPWKVIAPGDSPAKAPMTLYWIPASREDFKRSELLFSRPLTSYASQCVAMQVIRADDAARIEKLGAAGALPIAVLLDGDGKQLGKVDNDRGALNVSAVEKLVRDQLRAGEATLDARLEDARRKASAGDRDSAVATYKSICDLRCVFPRKAREAERELKRLDSLAANR